MKVLIGMDNYRLTCPFLWQSLLRIVLTRGWAHQRQLAALATTDGPLEEPLEAAGNAQQQEPTMMSREARAFFQGGDTSAGLLKWKVGSACPVFGGQVVAKREATGKKGMLESCWWFHS